VFAVELGENIELSCMNGPSNHPIGCASQRVSQEVHMKTRSTKLLVLSGSAATAVLFGAAAMALVTSLPAFATEQFAKDTGKSCGACHQAAAGGGPLTPYGEKFKANGDKAP
jgi:hypothetical protein